MKLYNTLTRTVEPVVPRTNGKLDLFVCGPTVYDYAHIGHAKTYVQFDVLARILRANDLTVHYLQNITDIDDKIITKARDQSTDWHELAGQFEAAYFDDMKQLGINTIDTYARATDFIPDIIGQVQRLLDTSSAYVIDSDGIYFEISTFADYGKLSGRTELAENDSQSRIDQSDKKRGWNDFALWKFSKPDEPSWDAPFGSGRPGWHIEDTAITEHFFGPQYDMHGGGIDLIFPHHEAEITQMEAASGKSPLARHWVHTGFVTVDGTKMSKSLGNFYTIRDVLEKYPAMAIRLFVLQTHYRSSINFTWDNLDAANNRLQHWQAIAALRHQTHDTLDADSDKPVSLRATSQAIIEALSNDLDTPTALKLIDQAFNHIETSNVADIHQYALASLIDAIDEVLGLELAAATPDITDEQKRAIVERFAARQAEDWATSDAIRDQLAAQGIYLKDGEHQTTWSYS